MGHIGGSSGGTAELACVGGHATSPQRENLDPPWGSTYFDYVLYHYTEK